jgi:hypothetical protein
MFAEIQAGMIHPDKEKLHETFFLRLDGDILTTGFV